MRSLKFSVTLCAFVGLAGAIVSKNEPNSLTAAHSLVPTLDDSRTQSVTTQSVVSRDNVNLPASQRKDDFVGSASYEYERVSPYPGDFKYGGGYGVGGYGYGGYGGYDPLKGLLVPLAGVALLGAAALFVSNPVLLQLGVIGGKRRRREAIDGQTISYDKLKDIKALETFIEQLPHDQVAKQEKKLVANYLKCSSSLGGSHCLERLACEIQKPTSNSTALDRQVLEIVTGEMMNNEYVPKDLKQRIKKAEALGLEEGKCEKYFCGELDLM